mmetsp:Transcript_40728/g.81581  ORF Transcript_40728/g.81581 Transcript_40728/m.81581 type:complete len:213 (-) Transcript_40728:359-997(-)
MHFIPTRSPMLDRTSSPSSDPSSPSTPFSAARVSSVLAAPVRPPPSNAFALGTSSPSSSRKDSDKLLFPASCNCPAPAFSKFFSHVWASSIRCSSDSSCFTDFVISSFFALAASCKACPTSEREQISSSCAATLEATAKTGAMRDLYIEANWCSQRRRLAYSVAPTATDSMIIDPLHTIARLPPSTCSDKPLYRSCPCAEGVRSSLSPPLVT